MTDVLNASVESQEVAEPEDKNTASVESQEVAEPEDKNEELDNSNEFNSSLLGDEGEGDGKTPQDTAFARLRRENEASSAKIAELELKLAEMELEEQAQILADEYDLDENERKQFVSEFLETEKAELQSKQENEELKKQLEEMTAQFEALQLQEQDREDLKEIQEVYNNVTSIDTLGEEYDRLRIAGLTALEAYEIVENRKSQKKVTTPKPTGRASKVQENDYYTSEELDELTVEEINANKEKVDRSMRKLFG